MGFSDFSFSVQMRDTMEKIAASAVERLRPRDRYGIVSSVDYTTGKASVTLNGDDNPVQVNMGNNIPTIGQTVRVSGTSGDKFISGVVGGETPAASAMRLRINYFSASESPASYPQGYSTMDVNSSAGWPGTGFVVTHNLNINRFRQYFYGVSTSNWSSLERYAHVNAVGGVVPWSDWQANQTVFRPDDVSVDRAVTAGNWYRIARIEGTDNGGWDRAFADVEITSMTSGIHEFLRFSAGAAYSGGNSGANGLVLHHYTSYASTFPAICMARIIAPGGTYGGAYLEIRAARTCTIRYRLKHGDWMGSGQYWVPAWQSGNVPPTGYAIKNIVGLGSTSQFIQFSSASFMNGWSNYGDVYAPARYTMNPGSQVQLEGLIRNGTLGQPALTLPEGYRPGKRLMFPSVGGNAAARVDVNTDGNIIVVAGTTSFITLDAIKFQAQG